MLSATEKLMQLLIHRATGDRVEGAGAVRDRWSELDGTCELGDVMSEVRSGQHDTGLDCAWSRHYESKAVAAQMLDGSWVGWTYWYGGGKHGEPGSIPWVEDAYDVDVTEVVEVVKKFAKKDAPENKE